VPDPYFSATKLEWLLRRCDVPQTELAFGTVDAWLVWKLTGGSTHATDLTNASRTMLLDLASGEWDDELLGAFGVERSILPSVVASSGVVAEGTLLGGSVPIAGIAGDQQAALFGQGCHAAGQAKVTYGTGTFVLVNLGETTGPVGEGVLRTAVAVTPGAPRQMAAEGAVLVGGAALQWLRDGLGLIGDAGESERLAAEVESTEGVHFVPALTGLGSPQWRPDARGVITGLTRGTNRAHVVRAALEAIAHQVADVVDALPLRLDLLRADGGATANRFLMQFQADLLGSEVHVSAESEATALGAAALAGLGVGVWRGPAEVRRLIPAGTSYEPRMRHDEAAALRTAWRSALARAL
jgi:glycerol kinase